MSSARSASRGFSFAELLVVLAILGLSVAVAVPLVSNQIRMAAIRLTAGEFASDLRAARMIAVSGHRTVTVDVDADPTNAYEYTDSRGKVRRVALPEGVRIVSSTPSIEFHSDGSVPGGAVTVFEARAPGGSAEQWRVEINVLGLTRTEYARVP